jgi:NTP pyrophosphatase (non-canonical NTP hydrolase)
MNMEKIIKKIREFRDARDWQQFHNPKDMAIAISVESAELLEHFLWKSNAEVEKRVAERKEQVSDEIADIGIYLFELADILGNFVNRTLAFTEKNFKGLGRHCCGLRFERLQGRLLRTSSLLQEGAGHDGARGIRMSGMSQHAEAKKRSGHEPVQV